MPTPQRIRSRLMQMPAVRRCGQCQSRDEIPLLGFEYFECFLHTLPIPGGRNHPVFQRFECRAAGVPNWIPGPHRESTLVQSRRGRRTHDSRARSSMHFLSWYHSSRSIPQPAQPPTPAGCPKQSVETERSCRVSDGTLAAVDPKAVSFSAKTIFWKADVSEEVFRQLPLCATFKKY